MELPIRTAMLGLGGSLLERLLAADTGHHGPRTDCGAGHQAGFVGYRDKTIDTVLGPVQVRRAYYHCADCGHGVVPRDDELGVAGSSLSPGLATMVDRAGAAAPFAKASSLLGDLAGIALTTKRVERAAEADGAAAAAATQAHAGAILSRRVVPLPPAPLPDKLYIAVDGTGVPMVPAETAGRAGKAADGRAHTREIDQTRLPVHPFQPGPRRPTRARPRLLHLPGHPRPRRTVRPAGARRGPPPRIRTHPPTHRARRRRTLDLEPGRATPPRRHPDRRPLPRPRAPARPG